MMFGIQLGLAEKGEVKDGKPNDLHSKNRVV